MPVLSLLSQEEILNLSSSVESEVIAWRRHLHENPELSFKEFKTSAYIEEQLNNFGNLIVSRPTATSVMARLIGKERGKVVAIRADIDALPILEETDLSFKSKVPGVMHACGHDAHAAILLGVARILSNYRDQLIGEIRFLFQHAEETLPGGAAEMVKARVLDGVDSIIGLHIWPGVEVGTVSVREGPIISATDTFQITLHGKGGHAGAPHKAIDPITAMAQLINGLNTIVSRNIDPVDVVALSYGKIAGGTIASVIPDSVFLEGDADAMLQTTREKIPERIENIVKGVCLAMGTTYTFNYIWGYKTTINNPEVTKVVREQAQGLFGNNQVTEAEPVLGGEDFSAFVEVVPGCFFLLGVGGEYFLHHSKLKIEEKAFKNGVATLIASSLALSENL